MPNIPFQARWHFLHILSHVWSCCFTQIIWHTWKCRGKNSSTIQTTTTSHINRFCKESSNTVVSVEGWEKPPILLQDHSELCGGLGSRAWAEGTRGASTGNHSPDLSFWLKEWRGKKSDQSTSKMQSLASYLPFLPLPCFSKTSSVAEANIPQSYS